MGISGRLLFLFGCYALIGGIVSLFGWVIDNPRLADWDGDGITIQPNASVCAILSGLAILLLAWVRLRGAVWCGGAIFLIGAATLIEWLGGVSFGIDSLLMFGREWGRVGVVHPGRMGPPGSLSWTLIGAAFLLSDAQPRLRRLAPAFAMMTAAISLLSMVGYLYGVDQLYALPHATVIALQTSTFIFAVSLALIMSQPDRDPMRLLGDDGPSGALARRALPVVVIVPIALGFLREQGRRAELFDSGLGTALLVLILTGFLFAMLWSSLIALRNREHHDRESARRLQATLESLRDSESRERSRAASLQAVLDTSPLPIWVALDPKCEHILGNPAGKSILGSLIGDHSSIDGTPGSTHGDRCFRNGAEVPLEALPLQRAARERVVVRDEEYEIVRRDGTRVWLLMYASPILEAGELGGAVAVAVDITERKIAVSKLQSSHATFYNLVHDSPLGVYIVDSAFRIAEVSAGARPAFQNVQPLLGHDFVDAMRTIWPEPFATEAIDRFRHTLKTGESYVAPSLTHRRKDVDSVESYEWQIHRCTLPDGSFGVVCHFYNSTELRRAEEKIRRQAALIRAVNDSTSELIFLKDRSNRLTYANAATLQAMGMTEDKAIGSLEQERFSTPAEMPEIAANDQHVLRTGETITGDEAYTGADGKRRLYRFTKSPLRDDSGEVVGVIGVARDVTEERRAEEERERLVAQLREADRRKDEFLATLAHELRNPLAPIRNSLYILRSAGSDGAIQRRVVDTLERQTNHIIRLVDDLLEVSRITRGKIELRKEHIELAEIVRTAVETASPAINEAKHHLALHLPSEPIRVHADPVRLAQVIANLLNNAAKYTETGGQIWLTAGLNEQGVAISIRDNGTGIPLEMLPRVFDLFAQVDRTVGRSQGGLGIGLALVKNLVELHGGTVEAHSDGPGLGSEFIVRLPMSAVDAVEKPNSGGDSRCPRADFSQQRILVVDDNRDAAESFADLLGILGADVTTAFDGPSALETVRRARPAIVFLDLGMPGMDGFAVAAQIRREQTCSNVRLIALTGWGQEEDRQRSREAGFDHHMTKPPSIDAIQEILTRFASSP
jgi:PAS domain S-box-containing protein